MLECCRTSLQSQDDCLHDDAGTRLAAIAAFTSAAAVVQQAASFINSWMQLPGCAFSTIFPKAQALSRMRWKREGGGGERPSV